MIRSGLTSAARIECAAQGRPIRRRTRDEAGWGPARAYADAAGKKAAIVDRVSSRYIAAVAGTGLTRHQIVIHRIEAECLGGCYPRCLPRRAPPSFTLAPRP